MSAWRRIGYRIIAVATSAAVGGVALAAIAAGAGARINTSPSIPLGLYWTTKEPIAKGEYVLFCPPNQQPFIEARERGYLDIGHCPGQFGYIMKKILAAKGDHVAVQADGVHVNGSLLPYSAPVPADSDGRAMPHYRSTDYTLEANQLLLMTDVNPLSYDSRYFGPINTAQIRAVIRPIYTWKGE